MLKAFLHVFSKKEQKVYAPEINIYHSFTYFFFLMILFQPILSQENYYNVFKSPKPGLMFGEEGDQGLVLLF